MEVKTEDRPWQWSAAVWGGRSLAEGRGGGGKRLASGNVSVCQLVQGRSSPPRTRCRKSGVRLRRRCRNLPSYIYHPPGTRAFHSSPSAHLVIPLPLHHAGKVSRSHHIISNQSGTFNGEPAGYVWCYASSEVEGRVKTFWREK